MPTDLQYMKCDFDFTGENRVTRLAEYIAENAVACKGFFFVPLLLGQVPAVGAQPEPQSLHGHFRKSDEGYVITIISPTQLAQQIIVRKPNKEGRSDESDDEE